MIQYFLPEP